MKSIKLFIAGATKWIGSIVLVMMALQIVVDVLMRNMVGAGLPATTELVSRYYMLAVSFVPVAYAEIQRRHVEASIFTDMMPKKLHAPIYFVGFALSLVVYVLMTWGTAKEAMVQTSRGAFIEAGSMMFPTWPSYWILPLGFALMSIVLVLRIIQIFAGTFRDAPAETAIITEPLNQVE